MAKHTLNKLVSTRLADTKRPKNRIKNGYKNNLDSDYIKHLLKQSGNRCPILKRDFVFIAGHPLNFSVDRINSKKGYTRDNVWVVSTWANKAKSDLPEEQFYEYCKLVTEAT